MTRKTIALAAVLMSTAGAAAAGPAVLDHHVSRMKAGDLQGVLADYAPDAVVVTPPGLANASGVFAGPGVRQLFSVLTDAKHVPGNRTMTVRYETTGPGVTVMHWTQFPGSAQQVVGHDVFVVRGGKIAFQSVSVDAPK
jgi:hypothetical protein